MEHKFKIVEVLKENKNSSEGKSLNEHSPLSHDINAHCEADPEDQCVQNGIGVPNGLSKR